MRMKRWPWVLFVPAILLLGGCGIFLQKYEGDTGVEGDSDDANGTDGNSDSGNCHTGSEVLSR